MKDPAYIWIIILLSGLLMVLGITNKALITGCVGYILLLTGLYFHYRFAKQYRMGD